jgi:hypothetical protein
VEGTPREGSEGYPEEQPGDVATGDQGEGDPRKREGGDSGTPEKASGGDDGKATGNPHSAG